MVPLRVHDAPATPDVAVAVSASALVAGATALALGAILLPTGGGDSSESLQLAEQNDGRWLAVGGATELTFYDLVGTEQTVAWPVGVVEIEWRRG